MVISVEQAILRMLEHTPILNSEQAPLEEAVGRSLAQNLYARYPQPPFDRSPLDGYAVRGEDLVGAAPASPAVLQVVDKLYAGSVANIPVKPGQAVRLMTGSMIPIGADCVVKQEDTDEGEAVVNVFRPVSSGSNICWEGEEYQAGDLLLPGGQRVDAAAVAVAAGAGYRMLAVRRRMKAVILSTGDELQHPGEDLYPGRIYDSNAAYLRVCLQ